jgi:hypothetical protein
LFLQEFFGLLSVGSAVTEPLAVVFEGANFLAVVVGHGVGVALVAWVGAVLFDVLQELGVLLGEAGRLLSNQDPFEHYVAHGRAHQVSQAATQEHAQSVHHQRVKAHDHLGRIDLHVRHKPPAHEHAAEGREARRNHVDPASSHPQRKELVPIQLLLCRVQTHRAALEHPTPASCKRLCWSQSKSNHPYVFYLRSPLIFTSPHLLPSPLFTSPHFRCGNPPHHSFQAPVPTPPPLKQEMPHTPSFVKIETQLSSLSNICPLFCFPGVGFSGGLAPPDPPGSASPRFGLCSFLAQHGGCLAELRFLLLFLEKEEYCQTMLYVCYT